MRCYLLFPSVLDDGYLASNVGFSPALGAFIMGSIIAETTKQSVLNI
jgi:Kef-type K+ transport system membrane component KefB